MIQKQIILNNLLVNYYFTQEVPAAAPTVIFLHGWGSNGRIWQRIFEVLKDSGWNLYGLDLPGFGQSSVPGTPWSLGDYAAFLKTFIVRLNLKRVYLVGHSLGGRVAIKTAVLHPSVLRKLVLADSGGFRPHIAKRGLLMLLAKILKPVFMLPGVRRLRPAVYHFFAADDYLATPELKAIFLNILNEDVKTLALGVTCPTLIVWGEKDRVTPLSFGRELKQAIPGSRLKVLAKAGHFSFLEKPEEFGKFLKEFFNEPV